MGFKRSKNSNQLSFLYGVADKLLAIDPKELGKFKGTVEQESRWLCDEFQEALKLLIKMLEETPDEEQLIKNVRDANRKALKPNEFAAAAYLRALSLSRRR